jgi:hypothetical protein
MTENRNSQTFNLAISSTLSDFMKIYGSTVNRKFSQKIRWHMLQTRDPGIANPMYSLNEPKSEIQKIFTILKPISHFVTLVILFVCFGFYVTSTQHRSYRDVPALLVETTSGALFQARTGT